MHKAKRWVMRSKRDVALEEFDYDTTTLQPREIAVRVEFTVISPGTECANYQALDHAVNTPGSWCAYPSRPGYAGLGRVIGVGSAVAEHEIGDTVLGPFRHATHHTVNVDQFVGPAHPAVKPEHAAHTRLISIAMTALQVLRNDPFMTAGVWGQGMISNLVAQVLRSAGGRVVGIDPLPERRALANRCGIRETLDPNDPKFADKIEEITRGVGFDVTVDTTGHAPTTLGLPSFTRQRGQMVVMTHWRSQPVVDASAFVREFFVKGITIHGAHEGSPYSEPWSNYFVMAQRKFAKIQEQLAAGGIQVAPLISHAVKPHQCKEAYEGLCFDRGNWWGVVVDWRT